MHQLQPIFHKTITLATVFGHDLMENFSTKEISSQTEINQAFIDHTLAQFQSHEQLEMISQILEIEHEKFTLRDTNAATTTSEIYIAYSNYNSQREHLLQLSAVELRNTTLQQSPYVSCYASDWKFVFINETDNSQLLDKILEFPKDEYYFVFQQTDVFDAVLQTNVLEFHLTKYEFYVLQLFQEATTVETVFKAFFEVFDIETEAQMRSLMAEAVRIVKFLMYRKFIVAV